MNESLLTYSSMLFAAFVSTTQPTFVNNGDRYSYDIYETTYNNGTIKNLARIYTRVEHISQLGYNWDGNEALPISTKVLSNIKDVLLLSNDSDWANWMIGPDVNATIRLQSKKNSARISLGATEYSYFAYLNNKRIGRSHEDFIPDKFLLLMRSIG